MTDIRAAAQEEVERLMPIVGHDPMDFARSVTHDSFVNGAMWAQERITPTREQVSDELRKHKLVHVSESRKSAFCACNPSVTAGVKDNLEWFEAHRADAILALMKQ